MNPLSAYLLTLLIIGAVYYCWPTSDDDVRRCGECDQLWHTDRVCPRKDPAR